MLVTTFTGAMIQTVSGFGFGIFSMCLLPFFMPGYITAAIVSNMCSVLLTIFILAKMYKKIRWRALIFTLGAYFVVSVFIVRFQKTQSDNSLKKLLGVFLIGLSIYFFLSKSNHKIKPTPISAVIAGSLSGVTGGLFGASGPPVVMYFLGATDDNDEYIATIQSFFLIACSYLVLVRALNGLFSADCIKYWAVGAIGVFPGMFLGTRLRAKIKPEFLKRLVYIFMAASGIVMLF